VPLVGARESVGGLPHTMQSHGKLCSRMGYGIQDDSRGGGLDASVAVDHVRCGGSSTVVVRCDGVAGGNFHPVPDALVVHRGAPSGLTAVNVCVNSGPLLRICSDEPSCSPSPTGCTGRFPLGEIGRLVVTGHLGRLNRWVRVRAQRGAAQPGDGGCGGRRTGSGGWVRAAGGRAAPGQRLVFVGTVCERAAVGHGPGGLQRGRGAWDYLPHDAARSRALGFPS